MTQEKEDRILEAAVTVFSKEGFHNARMEAVAREAGVAVGTIYNYFQNKEDLLLAIFQAEFEERIHFYEELQKSSLSIPEQIRELLRGHFSSIQGRVELSQVLLRERFNWRGEIKEKAVQFYRGMLERIERLIERGVELGWIRSCNPRIVALTLFVIVETISASGLIYSEQEAKAMLENAPDELASLIWRGLEKGDAG
jgi:TetR/AcrR family fatty acid metabolism transcriptional regulator